MNTAKLKAVIKEKGMTNKQIANAIDVNESTFYRKIERNGDSFTLAEANKIAMALSLTAQTAQEIFFNR